MLIFEHFWVVLIIVMVANGLLLRSRSKPYIAKNPQLKAGYQKLITGFVILGNIPWVIMAIGDFCGLTQSTIDFFQPRGLNPIVLAFHASIILLWGLLVYWVYFRNGAAFLERHPGWNQRGNQNVSAGEIKRYLPFVLLGGVAGMVAMWVMG